MKCYIPFTAMYNNVGSNTKRNMTCSVLHRRITHGSHFTTAAHTEREIRKFLYNFLTCSYKWFYICMVVLEYTNLLVTSIRVSVYNKDTLIIIVSHKGAICQQQWCGWWRWWCVDDEDADCHSNYPFSLLIPVTSFSSIEQKGRSLLPSTHSHKRIFYLVNHFH